VFNQILGGVGVFHRGPVVVPAPVVVARPAPVYVPAPIVVARPYPVYVPAPRHVVIRERPVFCPPGHARRGWCDPAPVVHPGWRY